jgi:hypothetical protein
VFKLFHEGDLTDSSGWGPLFCIEVYLFECHDFICCSGTALGNAWR